MTPLRIAKEDSSYQDQLYWVIYHCQHLLLLLTDAADDALTTSSGHIDDRAIDRPIALACAGKRRFEPFAPFAL